ncbi:unnamed protein product [Ixodes hexagonus]
MEGVEAAASHYQVSSTSEVPVNLRRHLCCTRPSSVQDLISNRWHCPEAVPHLLHLNCFESGQKRVFAVAHARLRCRKRLRTSPFLKPRQPDRRLHRLLQNWRSAKKVWAA